MLSLEVLQPIGRPKYVNDNFKLQHMSEVAAFFYQTESILMPRIELDLMKIYMKSKVI